jgi:hypothetical protein
MKTTFIFKKNIHFLLIFTITAAFLPQFAFSQATNPKSHAAAVTVNAYSVITVTPGTVPTLAIPGGATAVVTAGVDNMTVTDNTTVLKWGTNSVNPMKVTIAATSISPKYTLQVLANNIAVVSGVAGTAAPQFSISTGAQSLITNIGLSSGSCNILYTGIAPASQGMGNFTYSITFTIIAGS